MNSKETLHSLDPKEFRNYQGGYFRTLVSPEDSGQSLAILDLVLPRGAEPPPHIHTREDETFYVLEGELQVRIGETLHTLKSGEAIFAPRNVPHSFKIVTETARIVNLITPGSLWSYFMAFSEPCKDTPRVTPPQGPPPQEYIQAMMTALTQDHELKFV